MKIDVSKVPSSIIVNSARIEILNHIEEVAENYHISRDTLRGILYEALAKNEVEASKGQAIAYGTLINNLNNHESDKEVTSVENNTTA